MDSDNFPYFYFIFIAAILHAIIHETYSLSTLATKVAENGDKL